MSAKTGDIGQSNSQSSLTVVDSRSSIEESDEGPLLCQTEEKENELHPLLIDLILESVLKNVRPNDLKASRRVCKKWSVMAIPFMRSSFLVSIRDEEICQGMRENRSVGDFVETFKSNLFGIPFVKFRLGSFPMTAGDGKEFLQLCGDTAKEIDLDHLRSGPYVHDVLDVLEILRSSTNLEFFKLPWNLVFRSRALDNHPPTLLPRLTSLKKIAIPEMSPVTFYPTFLEKFFMAGENICDISVFECFERGGGNSIIAAVLNVIENRRMESVIQSLEVRYGRQKHVDILRRMAEKPGGLKLKKLIFHEDEDLDATQLATIFKDTLEYLDLRRTICTSFTQFPRTPHLKFLTLLVSNHFNSIPVNFNDIFPTLRSLELNFIPAMDAVVHADFFSKFECCATLKSLKMYRNDDMEMCTFDNILITFPNLTKLDLKIEKNYVETEILRKIWNQMSQLEDLTIQSRLRNVKNLDAVFTGIPIEKIGHLDILKGLEEMTVEDRRKTIQELKNGYCKSPGIGNLIKLRRLDLSLTAEYDGIRTSGLTDVSGYLAFYSMNQLNHLRLSCEFTKTCCEILTAEMRLESCSFFSSESEIDSDILNFPMDDGDGDSNSSSGDDQNS